MNIHQNFTRTWRSKTFEEIVGQELSVRLLKNSLAKNRMFPVYLFSGLRGSGKTSVGRIFAAAVNCENRNIHENSMVKSIPCLTCESCLNVRAGSHPDFIEIDAASHTGVDNVRQIIESAAFLPVMSLKKVYLIDEAHMLSKAAFNAFLKILEEPPATVIFLLATTEAHKIPDTVRSRSLHLFFDPVPESELVAHLKNICSVEKIEFQEQALINIAQQSEGSVRDALNSMERIVLAEGKVTNESTDRTLGLIHDQLIIRLFEKIAQGAVDEIFAYCYAQRLDRYNPLHIWKKMVQILGALLREKTEYGYPLDVASLKTWYSSAVTLEFFDLLYRSEAHLIKTTAQYPLLESLFCKMAQRFAKSLPERIDGSNNEKEGDKKKSSEKVVNGEVKKALSASHENVQNTSASKNDSLRADFQKSSGQTLTHDFEQKSDGWSQFIMLLESLGNPIAASIFKQGCFISHKNCKVQVQFAKKFEFYHEWILAHESLWKPLLEKAFDSAALFAPEFISEERNSSRVIPPLPLPVSDKQSSVKQNSISQVNIGSARQAQSPLPRTMQKHDMLLPQDINDNKKWPMAHKITQMFPGTITVYKE